MGNLLKNAYRNSPSTAKAKKSTELSQLLHVGLAHHQAGDLGAAATCYGQILDEEPKHFDALHLLAMAALQSGDPTGAIGIMDQALSVRSDVYDAWINRSSILMELGQYQGALESCEQAIGLEPTGSDAWFNGGNAYAKLLNRPAAISAYRKALEFEPDHVPCLLNLAGELIDAGDLESARDALNRALELEPNGERSWLNLGVLLQENGERSEAKKAYEKALALMPTYTKASVNLANLLFEDGHVQGALSHAQHALESGGDVPEAHNAIANCYRSLGHPETATLSFQRAVQANLAGYGHHSNLLLCMLGDPTVDSESILDEALRYASRHAPQNNRANRKVNGVQRIGFVSGDLRTHPVGFFLEPLLAGLSGVETYLYANQSTGDAQSKKLEGFATGWRGIKNLSAEQVAALVRQDEIDVLVDLSGHTAGGRLDVFALRPAPVQVSWLGYSGTTGLSQFDALLGDAIVTPRRHDTAYSEPVVRLKHGFAPFPTSLCDQPVSELPGAANGYITFGSFNATTKLNDSVIEVWSVLLNTVPDSRLILKNLFLGDTLVQERYLTAFESHGVVRDRIELRGLSTRDQHWESFKDIDIALDPFPYSGATTTVDSLWMGVPIVTLMGDRYCGRMSASFLTAVGLKELIVDSLADYVVTAKTLAGDIERLRFIRAGLRGRMLASPLGDGKQFAASFLDAVKKACETSGAEAA